MSSESQEGEDDIFEVEERDTTVSHDHSDSEDEDSVDVDVNEDEFVSQDEHEEQSVDDETMENDDFGESESKSEKEARYDTDDPEDVIETVIEEYDGLILDDDTVASDFAQAVADADDEFVEEHWGEIEDRLFVGVTLQEFRRIAEQVELDFDFYEIRPPACNLNGSLVRVEFDDKGRLTTEKLLNFELRMEEKIRLPGEDGVTAEFVIDRVGKPDLTVEADPGITNDKRDFREHITSSYFDTLMEEEGREAMRDINKFIGSIDLPVKIGVEKIGIHDDKYVLPGGVVDYAGWVDDPRHTVIPFDDETAVHKEFDGEGRSVDDDEMREMIEHLVNIRDGERLTPVLGWFFATCHSSVIRKHYEVFNHLNITGTSGCGKTRTAELLTELAGFDFEGGFDIEDTAYSIDNKLHAIGDGFLWFDEYHPPDIKNHKLDKFKRKFKNSATGGTSSRGNWKGGEDNWEIDCPLLVTGESEMNQNAHQRRSISVRFGDITNDDQYAEHFKKLKGKGTYSGRHDKQAFSEKFYHFAVQKRNKGIKGEFEGCLDRVDEIVTDWDIELNGDEKTGLAIVMWGWELLHEFADRFDVDESELPTEEEMRASLRHCAGVNEDGQGGGRVTEEDEFMRLFSRAAAAGDYLELNTDYAIVKGNSVDCEIRIKTERVYDKISRYVRDHDSSTQLLDSGREYKSRFSQLADESGNYVDNVSVNTPPINRCTSIKVRDVVDSVPGFSAECIDGVEFNFIDYLEDDGSEGDDGDDDGEGDGDDDDGVVDGSKGAMQTFIEEQLGNSGKANRTALATQARREDVVEDIDDAYDYMHMLVNDGVLKNLKEDYVTLVDGVVEVDDTDEDGVESKVVDVDEESAVECLRDVVGESSNGAVTRSRAAYKLREHDVVSTQLEGNAVVKQLIDAGSLREVGGDEVTVITGGDSE